MVVYDLNEVVIFTLNKKVVRLGFPRKEDLIYCPKFDVAIKKEKCIDLTSTYKNQLMTIFNKEYEGALDNCLAKVNVLKIERQLNLAINQNKLMKR